MEGSMTTDSRAKLTPATVEALKNQGLNQTQIAERFGVTRQYVSLVKRSTRNFSQTPREKALESFPWNPGSEFMHAGVGKRMRDHLEYMATGGKGMSFDKLTRLRGFYRHLIDEGLVVEFDPTNPPSEGISTGGYAYRKRRASDGDLIVRVNEHTTITPEGQMLLRLPPRLP